MYVLYQWIQRVVLYECIKDHFLIVCKIRVKFSEIAVIKIHKVQTKLIIITKEVIKLIRTERKMTHNLTFMRKRISLIFEYEFL
jgi:hypothetical protein